MDLFSAIFEDKRAAKRAPSRGNAKANSKVRKPVKPNTIDNKSKTTQRSVSQAQLNKYESSRNDVRRTHSEANPQKRQEEAIVSKNNLNPTTPTKFVTKETDKNKMSPVKSELKKPPEFPPEVIGKYSRQSGNFEDSFETALEVHTDCIYDEHDGEFGRESFRSLDRDFFVEAYNKPGYELLETSVQLSFDVRELSIDDTFEKEAEITEDIIFVSDDDTDKIGIEAYNSIGHELREVTLNGAWRKLNINRNESFATCEFDDEQTGIPQTVERSQSSVSSKSTQCRESLQEEVHQLRGADVHCERKYWSQKFDEVISQIREHRHIRRSSSGASYDVASTELSFAEAPHEFIKKQFQQQFSCEEPVFEVKPLPPLLDNNCPIIDNAVIRRNSSLYSNVSNLSRNSSNASTGSYILALGSFMKKYDKFLRIDDSIQKLDVSFKIQTKADMIIQELLETEYNYIENLIKIKRDYIRYFQRLRIDPKETFGNILEILEETKDFYYSLQACGNDYEYIANTFRDYRHLLQLYPEYSKNKSQSNKAYIKFKAMLLDRQQKLRDKLDLASYLLTPVQRLAQYILLLKNLQKHVRKPQHLEDAINLVEKTMKRGNDYVAIASINNCGVDLTTKGSYIDRERFVLIKPRREEIVLFLFEQIVVFTVPEPSAEHFSYKSSIHLNDLQIIHTEGAEQTFQLKDYTKSKKESPELHTYTLEARTVKLRETWVKLIQSKLWEQLQKAKEVSKSYKIPDTVTNQTRKPNVVASSSVKAKPINNHKSRNRTSSSTGRKRNSTFYVEETCNYDTL